MAKHDVVYSTNQAVKLVISSITINLKLQSENWQLQGPTIPASAVNSNIYFLTIFIRQ